MPLTLRRLLSNYASLIGAVVAGVSFVTDLFLILVDILATRHNPYLGIVTYMILPGVTLLGVVLILAGATVRFIRLRRGLEVVELPRLDLNNPRHRAGLAVTFVAIILLLGLSAVGGYQAYNFSDSVAFCGEVCHTVMAPQYTAYLHSPHARVACVECHIGPGAEWFVRSKLSGLYQVYATLFDKYPRPIPTPIHDLRPAQETCEQCHWPAKFWGEQLSVRVFYQPDEQNTRREVDLLVKTGGGEVRGVREGIHWHMNIANKVWYIAADARRQVIPWVRVEDRKGRVAEYTATDHPLAPRQIREGDMRRMDCIDCHNQPSHRFLPPTRAVNLAMEAGHIPEDLPYIKKIAVEALVQPYASSADADRGIERYLRDFYEKKYPGLAQAPAEKLRAAVQGVQEVYRLNFFPDMRVSWRAYPDNIGHREWPGCFRCHDGRHASQGGNVLPRTCDTCHDFLVEQAGVFVRVPATPGFAHPWKLAGKHAEILCDACHTGGPAKPATCRGCHGLPASGAPMASLDCRQCHLKEQQLEPLADCKSCHAALGGLHTAGLHPDAGCTACHAPHAWLPVPRQSCLACHADKVQHFPGQPCSACHSFRTAAKSRTAGAPPPVTFKGGADSPGPVTFSHQAHLAKGLTCSNCHPRLFKMQAGGLTLTMDKMAAGQFCGACHNGKKAFGVMDGDRCSTCHKS
jgi:c(7)-type cytochrome triheme protein